MRGALLPRFAHQALQYSRAPEAFCACGGRSLVTLEKCRAGPEMRSSRGESARSSFSAAFPTKRSVPPFGVGYSFGPRFRAAPHIERMTISPSMTAKNTLFLVFG